MAAMQENDSLWIVQDVDGIAHSSLANSALSILQMIWLMAPIPHNFKK